MCSGARAEPNVPNSRGETYVRNAPADRAKHRSRDREVVDRAIGDHVITDHGMYVANGISSTYSSDRTAGIVCKQIILLQNCLSGYSASECQRAFNVLLALEILILYNCCNRDEIL